MEIEVNKATLSIVHFFCLFGRTYVERKGNALEIRYYLVKGGITMNKIERLIDQLELLEYLLENRLNDEQDKFEENFSQSSFHLLAKLEKMENQL